VRPLNFFMKNHEPRRDGAEEATKMKLKLKARVNRSRRPDEPARF
jgi:hypothetical protein